MTSPFHKHLKAVERGMVDATFNEMMSERMRHDFETRTLPRYVVTVAVSPSKSTENGAAGCVRVCCGARVAAAGAVEAFMLFFRPRRCVR